MDDSVLRAMARWPDVPDVYGWLSLDRRGRWCLRGEPVTHHGAIAFIGRNYACTGDGRWYFQNGPQRVFVDLDYVPWILGIDGEQRLVDHCGQAAGEPGGAWLDEDGNLLLLTGRGVGLLCDRDLEAVSDDFRLAGGEPCDEEALADVVAGAGGVAVFFQWSEMRLNLESIRRHQVAARFGFEPRPRAGDA